MLGPPGSGKGTQAYKLSKLYNIPHISSGNLLRNNPNLPDDVKKILNSGGLLSDEMMVSIVKNKLKEECCANGWILDGFPRTIIQGKELEKIINGNLIVIYLKVDDDEIKRRISLRQVCKNCQAVFHVISRPSLIKNKCDFCDDELIQRDDDSTEIIEKRLHIYKENTTPLINFYESRGELLTIDAASNANAEDIFNIIKSLIN